MKLFNFFALLLMLSVCAACGDDDECSQADWVGTYTGTVVCTEDGDVDDPLNMLVRITASGSEKLVIVQDVDGDLLISNPTDFNDCNLTTTITSSDFTITITAELDGNNLSITDLVNEEFSTNSCVVDATRN